MPVDVPPSPSYGGRHELPFILKGGLSTGRVFPTLILGLSRIEGRLLLRYIIFYGKKLVSTCCR
jgi:hypothetical protein